MGCTFVIYPCGVEKRIMEEILNELFDAMIPLLQSDCVDWMTFSRWHILPDDRYPMSMEDLLPKEWTRKPSTVG